MTQLRIIWKYPLTTRSGYRVTLEMPKGAEILTLQTNLGKPTLWAMVDAEADKEQRVFDILMTGETPQEIDKKNYIGTFQVETETFNILVFHVFEVREG